MAEIDNDENAERKGLIYETFVALAVESAFGSYPEIGTPLKGVIADQDIIWPNSRIPKLVISVTHWGSHEAAKMKFWRIHEDFYEVKRNFPEVVFMSVVFDRNESSDANLCILLDNFFSLCGISDLNCESIKKLQTEVSTKTLMNRFGSGADIIVEKTRVLMKHDNLKSNIQILGKYISERYKSFKPNAELKKSWLLGLKNSNFRFRKPIERETYFKPAIITLIDVGVDIETIIKTPLNRLPKSLFDKLIENNSLLEDPTSLCPDDYIAGPPLNQLHKQGLPWCKETLDCIITLVSDPSHPLYAYHDHILDVTNTAGCNMRLSKLMGCCDGKAVYELITVSDSYDMNRCWPIDYAMAIQRAHVKAGEYGFQKLSNRLNIKYIGGISPVPRFASGDREALDNKQLTMLCDVISEFIFKWDKSKVIPQTIQRDRRITLMKKLPALDVTLEAQLRKYLPKTVFKGTKRVKHPVSNTANNSSAGATDYNLLLENTGKRVWIFVAATYETTHKHKEVSGRLRGAKSTGHISKDDLSLLLVDGNLLFGSSRDERIKMISDAGWAGAYYLDEVKEMAQQIQAFLGC